MGYHIILHCTAIIKPEYLDCIKIEHFDYNQYVWTDEDEVLPEKWIEFDNIWRKLRITEGPYGGGFYEFKLEGDQFTFELSTRPFRYYGRRDCRTLTDAYRILMRDIIAPISSEILRCVFEHDDYNIESDIYTDAEVRDFLYPSPLDMTGY